MTAVLNPARPSTVPVTAQAKFRSRKDLRWHASFAKVGYAPEKIERICYLVGHHHTYNMIDGLDYQLLVEADFIVNFYEDGTPKENIAKAVERIFKTESGTKLVKTMFGL